MCGGGKGHYFVATVPVPPDLLGEEGEGGVRADDDGVGRYVVKEVKRERRERWRGEIEGEVRGIYRDVFEGNTHTGEKEGDDAFVG